MYPDISFILKELFGIDVAVPFKTFGLLLGLAIFSAAYVLWLELKRKERAGELPKVPITITEGEPASVADLITQALVGFLIGYKGYYIIIHYSRFVEDTQGMLMSRQGALVPGIIGAVVLAGWRYFEKRRHQLPEPVTKTVMAPPHILTGDMTLIAAVSGVIGSKVFDAIENWQGLMQHPIETLLSLSGLAFYGGLIFGAASIIVYIIIKKLPLLRIADAVAPTLIVGYGIGRIGCQLAGDGDWGIVNLNPKPFSWLPDWAWAYRYPHNVVGGGDPNNIPIPRCFGEYCMQLAQPVYPTPLYEILMAAVIFIILWSLRKRIKVAGLLFFIYLILNGIERYAIETIRINQRYNVLGMSLSQAQEIAILLVVTGITGCAILWTRRAKTTPL